MNYNLVIIGCRLVHDPEIRYSAAGNPFLSFRVASSRKFGEREDKLFLQCSAFGKTAESIASFFKKGDPILLEGRLVTDSFERKDGTKASETKMIVKEWTFAGPRRDSQEDHRSGATHREERFDPTEVREEEIPF